jgi:acyl-CoA synthetase (AMP-forming)/AMP-acid ligase II
MTMLGLMQSHSLMISAILTQAARHHGSGEVVSRTHENTTHRYTWADVERRSRRLVRVLQRLGIGPGDRVGTLAWNGYRHLEVYYAAPGMGAVCHTINPRLHADDITYIVNHAQDKVLFVDASFAPLVSMIAPKIADTVKTVVMLAGADTMPAVTLAPGMTLACYEQLMDLADIRREHRQRALLYIRHHRAAEGRAVQPSLDLAARLCRLAAGRAGHPRH